MSRTIKPPPSKLAEHYADGQRWAAPVRRVWHTFTRLAEAARSGARSLWRLLPDGSLERARLLPAPYQRLEPLEAGYTRLRDGSRKPSWWARDDDGTEGWLAWDPRRSTYAWHPQLGLFAGLGPVRGNPYCTAYPLDNWHCMVRSNPLQQPLFGTGARWRGEVSASDRTGEFRAPVRSGSLPSRLPPRETRAPDVLTGPVQTDGRGGAYVVAHDGTRVRVPSPAIIPDWRRILARPPHSDPAAFTVKVDPSLLAAPIVRRVGKQPVGRAYLPDGSSIEYAWRALPASDLITSHHPQTLAVNPDYPKEIQPRERTRAAYREQVTRMTAHLEPSLLTWSPHCSDGAPIIGPDNVVESGNGRTIAVLRAYAADNEASRRYREHVREWMKWLGIPCPASDPVLVRQRLTEVDRPAFARAANSSSMETMSASEQALADAAELWRSPTVLTLLRARSGEGGETEWLTLDNEANAPFIRKALELIAPGAKGNLLNSRGHLSTQGRTRMEHAAFAAAWGPLAQPLLVAIADGEASQAKTAEQEQAERDIQVLIAAATELRDSEIKTVLAGMVELALVWLEFRAAVIMGAVQADWDITERLLATVRTLQAAQESKQNVGYLLRQGGLLAEHDPVFDLLLLAAYPKGGRPNKATFVGALKGYLARVAAAVQDASQGSMFGPAKPDPVRALASAVVEACYSGTLPKDVLDVAAHIGTRNRNVIEAWPEDWIADLAAKVGHKGEQIPFSLAARRRIVDAWSRWRPPKEK